MIKILIAEDSKFLRVTTERALARAGYCMSSAGDGDEAMRLTHQDRPDLILLDMMLPKMSGLDMLKALKANPATQDIPVVILSGLSQKNANRLIADGAAAFFEKSGLELEKGPEKLLAAIQAVIAAHPKVTAAASST